MIIVIYHIVAKPFDQTITNAGVLAKELLFLSFAWFIPIFTDYVVEPYMRHICGNVMISFFLSMVGCNVLVTSIYALIRLKLVIKHVIVYRKKYTLRALLIGEK